MVRLDRIPYLFTGFAALLVACMGGTDGVENPKLSADFKPESGAAISGRVSLYGANLDPALDSTPFLTKDLVNGNVTITHVEMDHVVNLSLQAAGKDTSAPMDTTIRFNMVASSGDREAFVGGLAYQRLKGVVGFAKSLKGGLGSFGDMKESYVLPKAVPFYGRIGRGGAALGLDYVFIAGSPYHASIAKDSTFQMARMAQGTYGIYGADKDSAHYYQSNDTLNTTDSTYSAKDWGTVTFIPGR